MHCTLKRQLIVSKKKLRCFCFSYEDEDEAGGESRLTCTLEVAEALRVNSLDWNSTGQYITDYLKGFIN